MNTLPTDIINLIMKDVYTSNYNDVLKELLTRDFPKSYTVHFQNDTTYKAIYNAYIDNLIIMRKFEKPNDIYWKDIA